MILKRLAGGDTQLALRVNFGQIDGAVKLLRRHQSARCNDTDHEKARLKLVIDAAPLEHSQLVRGNLLKRGFGDFAEIEVRIDFQLVAFYLR